MTNHSVSAPKRVKNAWIDLLPTPGRLLKGVGTAALWASSQYAGASLGAAGANLQAMRPTAPSPQHPLGCRISAQPLDLKKAPMAALELEVNGLSGPEAAKVLAPIVGPVQVITHSWLSWLGLADTANKGAKLRMYSAVPDDSLAFGYGKSVEVVTPPFDHAGLSQVRRVAAAMAEAGGRIDVQTALHVHFSAPNTAQLVSLLRLLKHHEKLLFRLSRTSPRQQQHWCKPLPAALFVAFDRQAPRNHTELLTMFSQTVHRPSFVHAVDASRYYIVGLKYLATGGHIELRQFDGTVDPDTVQAYVELTMALATAARDGNLDCLNTHQMDRRRSNYPSFFLNAIGLRGPQFARTRQILLSNWHAPRAFELAEGEMTLTLLHASAGLLAGYALNRDLGGWWGLPMLATIVGTTTLRVGSVALEAAGLITYEDTYVVHKNKLVAYALVGFSLTTMVAKAGRCIAAVWGR